MLAQTVLRGKIRRSVVWQRVIEVYLQPYALLVYPHVHKELEWWIKRQRVDGFQLQLDVIKAFCKVNSLLFPTKKPLASSTSSCVCGVGRLEKCKLVLMFASCNAPDQKHPWREMGQRISKGNNWQPWKSYEKQFSHLLSSSGMRKTARILFLSSPTFYEKNFKASSEASGSIVFHHLTEQSLPCRARQLLAI